MRVLGEHVHSERDESSGLWGCISRGKLPSGCLSETNRVATSDHNVQGFISENNRVLKKVKQRLVSNHGDRKTEDVYRQ